MSAYFTSCQVPVPKLYLGTKMVAKLSLASKGVPKLELGNETTSGMRFAFPPYTYGLRAKPCLLTTDYWPLAPNP